ncbi:MAG TPA: sigma-70 family RNA polymerase sigma factor [Flavisolibacter sp.]|nr:sigma-70 family RNA polymerase sigma factor [Flavisolibacter sp.]
MPVNTTYEEQELVALLKAKDNQAFSYLYDNYAGALCGVVKQIVGDMELANDVLQEVFVSIWRKIDTYDASKGRLFTWMLNIARNAAIDKTRSKNYQVGLKVQSFDGNEYNHPVVRPGFDDFGLKKQLQKLKDEQRLLVDLSYYQGYTHEQIAKALNIPLGTVKTRLRSALSQLRTLLS